MKILFELGLSVAKSVRLVVKFPKLKTLSIPEFDQRMSYLSSKNIPKSRVRAMPWLVLHEPKDFEDKVTKISSILGLDDQSAISFVENSELSLKHLQATWHQEKLNEPELVGYAFKNRLEYFAHRLNCSVVAVADMVAKSSYIATRDFRTMNYILEFLLEGGINAKDIIADPWIFEGNFLVMMERMEVLKEQKISNIKPWMLRSDSKAFAIFMARSTKERELLLGHPDLNSFLQSRLNCSKGEATCILHKVSSIQKASATKLDGMIGYLYSKGYTTEHILQAPRILAHSKETISTRIEYLASHNVSPESLSIYCVSSKKWKLYLIKLGLLKVETNT